MNAAHVNQPDNQLGNQRNRGLIIAVDWLYISNNFMKSSLNLPKLFRAQPDSYRKESRVTRHLLKTDYLRKSNLTFTLAASSYTLRLSPLILHSTSLTLATHS